MFLNEKKGVFASLCGEGLGFGVVARGPVCRYGRGVLPLGLLPPRNRTEKAEERLCPPYQPARSSACSPFLRRERIDCIWGMLIIAFPDLSRMKLEAPSG